MKLIFVYNADSGLFNTASDIAHKILSPETYNCNLCALTHGYFKIKDDWVGFLEEIDADLIFLHRDEFIKQYNLPNIKLPAIYSEKDDHLSLWLDQTIINQMKTLDELKMTILEQIRKSS
ncbi:MAG: hypothetical protein OEZ15_05625 [Gammaproteobacteria bacterium]|nr:hypothetical protein [Gammaproteobacteria bacterium]